MILNGAYNNKIIENQLNSNAGGDLVWAQAILDPTSPIGVATEPPVVHCNVTVSDGGGGVTNQNGTVWFDNTAQHIDSCITQQ